MEYFDYDMGGFNLHVIKTNRFKTISYNINIRFEDEKDTERYMGMLSRLLIQTSSHFDSLRDINVFCASIYDPSYNIRILSSGAQDILTLSASFANEKYTEIGMNEANFKFLTSFIFEPKIIDNGFDREVFEIQKEKLLEYYRTMKDRPQDYASGRLSEEMKTRKYDVMKLNEFIQSIESLTAEELYDFYKKIMKEGTLDIFVCGDVNPTKIKNIFSKLIKFKDSKKKINHLIKQDSYNKKEKIIIEPSLNTQSNLVIGCKLMDLTDFERKYVFVLYSWILGGGMNSLLTQTVREKNSLCYYIYATRQNLFETMKIYAGINGSDFEKTYDLVKKEMKNMEEGNFPLELFEGVKEIYYNSLIKIEDTQSEVTGNYTSELFIHNDRIDVRKKQMEKVTKEDVMNLAKKVHIDTVYLLKGER